MKDLLPPKRATISSKSVKLNPAEGHKRPAEPTYAEIIRRKKQKIDQSQQQAAQLHKKWGDKTVDTTAIRQHGGATSSSSSSSSSTQHWTSDQLHAADKLLQKMQGDEEVTESEYEADDSTTSESDDNYTAGKK